MLVPRIPYDPQLILSQIHSSQKIKTVYILGTTDTGKTSLARYLLKELRRPRKGRKDASTAGKEESWCYLDADPGQSVIGPPTTLGLTQGSDIPEILGHQTGEPSGQTGNKLLRFLGTTSPGVNPEDAIASLKALADRSCSGGDPLLIDSSGLAEGDFGAVFQLRSLEAVRPELIIALEKNDELTPIMEKLDRLSSRNFQVIRMSTSPGVEEKTQNQRRQYRNERFRDYFSRRGVDRRIADLSRMKVTGELPDFSDLTTYHGLLSAVSEEDGWVLALAVITGFEKKGDRGSMKLKIISPAFSEGEARRWQFGRLRLSPDTWEEIQP